MNGEAGGDMRGGVYMVVEVVEGRDGEIDPGGRLWPAKPKTEPCGLGFGLGLKRRTGRLVMTCGVGCTR